MADRVEAGRDPAEMAWQWLERELKGRPVPALIALIGLGDGALLDALDRRGVATRVLALEPDAARAQTSQAGGTREAWLRSGRLVYLTDPSYAGADEAWRLFPKSGEMPLVLVNPQAKNAAGVARAAQALKKILFGVKANAEARRKFAPRYLVNSIRNIPAIAVGADLRVLTDAYRGVPAVIAAAGPSLDAAIPDLHNLGDGALLIAADTALRPLLVHGIEPQLVVALDPSVMNARHLVELPACPNTWLVSESALDRSATIQFEGRTLWFRVSNHEPWPWLRERGLDVGQIDVWGSVLTGAFQVAYLAGCDPIVIVGADLSFTGNRPYARGTTYEFDWAENAASGITLDETWRAQIAHGKPTPVADVRGGETPTTKSLVSFRDWMAARIERSGRRVINATGAGILSGAGIEQQSLRDVLPTRVQVQPVGEAARRPSSIDRTQLAAHLRAARSAPMTAWAEFAGPGFDPAAVDQALEEAAHALDTASGQALRSQSEQVEELTTLPERILDFRIALERRANVPRATGTDAADTLARAFRLLTAIVPAALSDDDMPRPIPEDIPGRELLGPWCRFSERVRWRVWLFEALVGAAWTFASPSCSEDPYIGRPIAPRDDIRVVPPVAGEPTAPPNSTHACALLVLEWLMAVTALGSGNHEDAGRLLSRWRVIEAALRPDVAAHREPSPCHATVEIECEGVRDAIQLPLPVAPRAMIRLLTGAVRVSPEGTFDLARLDVAGLRVGVGITSASEPSDLAPPRARVSPRLLTDVCAPRAAVAYEAPDGAVVVAPHWPQSLLVTADGTVRSHQTWPAAIVGEVPFGEDGAIAWGCGFANRADIQPPYVMYRTSRGGDVHRETLPVRATVGAWWRGRVYWYCAARLPGEWFGLASWTPGEDVRYEVPGVVLTAVVPGENELVLVDLNGAALRWQPGGAPEPIAGTAPATARATTAGWTATACPGGDVVQFDSADGRSAWMACYRPQRLAWIGPSLLVSTPERELVLFEDLLSTLDAF